MSSIERTASSDLEGLGEDYAEQSGETARSNALGPVPGGVVTLPRQWVASPREGEPIVSTPLPGQPGSAFRPNVITREEQMVRRERVAEHAPSKRLPIKQFLQPQARPSRQPETNKAETSAGKESQARIQPSEMSFDDRLREDRRVRKEAAEKARGQSFGSRLLDGFAAGAKQPRSQGTAQGSQLSSEDRLRLEGMTLAFAAIQGREINPAESQVFSQALQSGSDGFVASVRHQMGWARPSGQEVSSGAIQATRTVIQANVDSGFGQISRAMSNDATVQWRDEHGELNQLSLSAAVSELLSDAEISADDPEFEDAQIVSNNQIVAGSELGRGPGNTPSTADRRPHPQAAEVYRRFPELEPGAGLSDVAASAECERD